MPASASLLLDGVCVRRPSIPVTRHRNRDLLVRSSLLGHLLALAAMQAPVRHCFDSAAVFGFFRCDALSLFRPLFSRSRRPFSFRGANPSPPLASKKAAFTALNSGFSKREPSAFWLEKVQERLAGVCAPPERPRWARASMKQKEKAKCLRTRTGKRQQGQKGRAIPPTPSASAGQGIQMDRNRGRLPAQGRQGFRHPLRRGALKRPHHDPRAGAEVIGINRAGQRPAHNEKGIAT